MDSKKSTIQTSLNVITWIFIILSLFSLYISLRTEYSSMEYAIAALILWLLALGAKYLGKKYKE